MIARGIVNPISAQEDLITCVYKLWSRSMQLQNIPIHLCLERNLILKIRNDARCDYMSPAPARVPEIDGNQSRVSL